MAAIGAVITFYRSSQVIERCWRHLNGPFCSECLYGYKYLVINQGLENCLWEQLWNTVNKIVSFSKSIIFCCLLSFFFLTVYWLNGFYLAVYWLRLYPIETLIYRHLLDARLCMQMSAPLLFYPWVNEKPFRTKLK